MPKILVSEDVEIPGFVSDLPLEIVHLPTLWQDTPALHAAVADADALVVRNRTRVTPELTSVARKLRVIGRLGAGLDNIDLPSVRAAGMQVVYAPDANTQAVAEYCVGQIIAATRKLRAADVTTRDGHWDRLRYMGRELGELVVGIVGYGRIGQRLFDMLSALGCKPIVASRHVAPAEPTFVTLEQLFERSDVVSVHLSATAETRELIDERLLRRLRPDAVFLNSSRGEVVNENDLAHVVRARPDCTFVLDVRATEPPDDRTISELPNVVLTPHIAAFSHRAQRMVAETVFADVLAVLKDQEPQWPVFRPGDRQ